MRGRSWMGVAGFRRVGWVFLSAFGPVDVVVRGRGVWSCWGFPSEQELAGVVGGRECVDGSCWRVWGIPGCCWTGSSLTGSGVGVSAGSPVTVMVASAHGPPHDLPSYSPL